MYTHIYPPNNECTSDITPRPTVSMNYSELMYRNANVMPQEPPQPPPPPLPNTITNSNAFSEIRLKIKEEKGPIHSGHFMVSHFDSEAQDDEDQLAVPVPGDEDQDSRLSITDTENLTATTYPSSQQLSIETSLNKLFQCMSLAYRQKLTSPKWNRFKGIRLRWKDKIRLNNVIWRCWHMQFIRKQNTLVCQFASPLDVDTHNKPEAVVLEGKYWKRKLAAVTAEYKKWRMFYRNQIQGFGHSHSPDMPSDMDVLDWQPHSNDSIPMMVDEDYMEFMSDTLFSTIQSNQPYAFPDTREIARTTSLADFIQPSLVQLQPNLDEFMEFETLQDIFGTKLPPVPEEPAVEEVYRPSQTSLRQTRGTPSVLSTSNIGVTPAAPISTSIQHSSSSHNQPSSAQITNLGYDIIPSTTPSISQNVPTTSVENILSYPSETDIYSTAVQQQQAYEDAQHQVFMAVHLQQSQQPQQQQPSFAMGARSKGRPPRSSQRQIVQHGYTSSQPTLSYQQTFIPSPPGVNDQKLSSSSFKQSQANYPVTANLFSQIPSQSQTDLKSSSTEELFVVPKIKGRNRSRSGPSLGSRQNIQQSPPLVPNNDSSLQPPLLAQILTNNNQNASLKNSSIVQILPQSTTVLITTPVHMSQSSSITNNTVTSNLASSSIVKNSTETAESIAIRSAIGVQSPLSSPINSLNSPISPSRPLRPKMSGMSRQTSQPKEQRRLGHITSEYKRRCNIKNGFDMLHKLIPQLNQNPNAKLSKAAMLQKGADYIRQLSYERGQLKEEMDTLRQQIEGLNQQISNCQSLLPATGAPVSRQRSNKMKEMFDEYVRARTLENWKFWIFSILFEPLLVSFNSSVSTASLDDLYRSTLNWSEQHCSLVDLRPGVLNSLRYLCTSTDILTDPSKLPEEAHQAVLRRHNPS